MAWEFENVSPLYDSQYSNIHSKDRMEDMIRDIGEDSFQQAHMCDSLKDDSKTPLYPDCLSFTHFSTILKLINIKSRNGWTDKSFTKLLELLHEMLPKDNTLPTRHYEVKKILCLMGMEYEKMHACPNDCILYRKEFESLHKCPRCGVSRYKVKDDESEEDYVKKGLPAKALWYLPIILRFKSLFANVNDANNLR